MNEPSQPVDLRVRRTHKLLWDALMAELGERPFEDITVKDICQRAMVHRTTFYKHYEDKYALLEQGIRQIVETLLAHQLHLPPAAYSAENPPPYFIRMFEHAAQNQQFYRVMLCGEAVGPLEKMLKKYIVETVLSRTHDLFPAGQMPEPTASMHAHFVAGAALSVMAWWLDHDLPLSSRQMAAYLISPHGVFPDA